METLKRAAGLAFVYASDRARAAAFYGDTLGLALIDRDAWGDGFAFPGGTLRVTAVPDHRASAHPVVGWAVDDVRAAVAELKARGLAPIVYPGMGQDADGIWTAPDGGTRLAWFKDPDDNVLMLTQD